MWVQDENGEWFDDGLDENGQFVDRNPDRIVYQSPDFEEDQTPIPPQPPFDPLANYPNLKEKYPRGIRTHSLLGGAYLGDPEGDMERWLIRQKEIQARLYPQEIASRVRPDTETLDPRDTTEVIGSGGRIIRRMGGQDNWTTAGGNEPLPDYFKSGGYKGKPDDPHLDPETSVIYYPNEIHTRKEDGTWSVAKRELTPPGRKPTDGEINIVDFVNFHMNDVEPRLREQAKEARKKTEATYSHSTKALNEVAFDAKMAAVEERVYNELRNEEKTLATKHAERLQKVDDAKKNPSQATEWGLRERAAKGDLNAISALKQHEGEKKAEDILKREISDKDLYKPLINNLPKTKDEAVQANIRVEKYKTLYSMAEQGAGGLIPGLKGMLAPIAEAMGLDANTVTKMSEAQVYQLMARAAVGSQRLMLVGSGQVSNYEQALMQRLSGGSIKTSREAAKELFKFYIKESEGLVGAYNTQIDNISEKFPDVKKMYGYVGKGSTTQGGGKPRLTPEQAREALKQRGK